MNKRERESVAFVIGHLERLEAFMGDDAILVGRRKQREYANASDFTRNAVPVLNQKAEALAVFEKQCGSELALLFGLKQHLVVLLEKPCRMPHLAKADTHLASNA